MFHRVPTEIYQSILSFVADPLDLYAVRRTSHHFYAQAEAVQYPNVALTLVTGDFYHNPKGLPHGAFLRHLKHTPKAAVSVRSLVIHLQLNRHLLYDLKLITEVVESLSNLSHYVVYQNDMPDAYTRYFSGKSAPIPFAFHSHLHTLIIRNLRLPVNTHIFLEHQPQLEVVILDSDEAGYQTLRDLGLAQSSTLLPKLRVLCCNSATANVLLTGRNVVALRYRGKVGVEDITSNSVVSLRTDGRHNNIGLDIPMAFPNVKVLYIRLKRVSCALCTSSKGGTDPHTRL